MNMINDPLTEKKKNPHSAHSHRKQCLNSREQEKVIHVLIEL